MTKQYLTVTRIKFVTLLSVVLFFFCTGSAIGAAEYVGTEGCKCHRAEILDWEISKHARSFDLLFPGVRKAAKKRAKLDPDRDYSRDKRCVSCHVVGYKKKGGFVSQVETPDMVGVGCESCHGPGSEYRTLHGKKPLTFKKKEAKDLGQVYSSINKKICRKCHEHKDSPFHRTINEKYRFDLEEGLKKTRSFHKYYKLRVKH